MAYGWERYFALGKAELTEDMVAALICREMKWTWQEYQDQPAKFISTIFEMLQAEAKEAERKSKNN